MKILLLVVSALLTANLGWMIFGPAGGTSWSAPIGEPLSASREAEPTPALSTQQKALLESGDVNQLVNAGFSDEVARQLVAGRAYVTLRAKIAMRRNPAEPKINYWRNDLDWFSPANQRRRREEMAAQTEYAETLRSLFGEETAGLGGADDRFGFLPKDKRELLHRIERDYGEMQSDLHMEFAGFPLPSDQEKLKLLEQEKRRDILAALTPDEAEQLDLRSSQTAMTIRNMYGNALQTEADFRKIFALHKAFDERYDLRQYFVGGSPTQEVLHTRALAERQMHAEMRKAVGEETYASMIRASDQDYRTLSGLEKRLQLPVGSAQAVYESRDLYAKESLAISDNPNLSPTARREQLNTLAQQATTDLQASLGKQGAEIYARQSNWINLLKNGSAFSININAAPAGMFIQGNTIFPVHRPTPNVSISPAPATKAGSN